MSDATLLFLDTETTGLDPDRHEIWEVAGIKREPDGSTSERVWQLPVDLAHADAQALAISRWYERRWPWPEYDSRGAGWTQEQADDTARRREQAVAAEGPWVVERADMADWAALFAEWSDGCHLVGAVVSFDAERLHRLLRRHHACPTWHYHLVDVEALAAGWLAAGHDWTEGGPVGDKCWPPWDSTELSLAVGVDPGLFDRHTALGDAKWAAAVYDAVMGPQPQAAGVIEVDVAVDDEVAARLRSEWLAQPGEPDADPDPPDEPGAEQSQPAGVGGYDEEPF